MLGSISDHAGTSSHGPNYKSQKPPRDRRNLAADHHQPKQTRRATNWGLFKMTKLLVVGAIYTSNQVRTRRWRRDKVAHSQFYNIVMQVRLCGRPSRPFLVENLKIGETCLLFYHSKMEENRPYYKLLYHDMDSGLKLWARLPLHEEFTFKSLYWGRLEDVLVHCKEKLTVIIYMMLCMPHYSFMIGVQTLFEQYVSTSAQKQTCYILLKARCTYLSLIATVSLGFHYQGVFTMKLFLPNGNSQISFRQVVLIYTLITTNLCKIARVSQPHNNGVPSSFEVPASTMFPRSIIREIGPLT
ncbi:LOW QUALITY PROTEIN: hypothetical protein Cgig2_008415 [Carnegiea gigantea]|uniref:Uncharacterized protein n=1 Tax=Carnegiea gigantea TaxID=171969 RepID=A0A9Q1K321_9CARY|nr:LOW QUALITY PROTEIN: hypothetical protein Cgig2_008415 [Carnegiea gigantea]